MNTFRRFADYSGALRCSKSEAAGVIVDKRFVKDAGFGDCPMFIAFEFEDVTRRPFVGKHVGTESSYGNIEIGDRIQIRYLPQDPEICAPRDSLGIIMPMPGEG